jgi:SNF2 family DNA or RNA helicase
MVRNTRSVIDLKLPQRFASTVKLEAPEAERRIYSGLKDYLREQNFNKHMVNLLLREAGSSPFALRKSLLKLPADERILEITGLVEGLGDICKGKALVDILKKDPREKKIVFTQYLKSLDYLTDLLAREKIACTTFSGNMSTRDKDRSIAAFKGDVPVLLCTESGGEGRNLQFCRTIINFDLPWNPMKIEQRIGRLHRIGQTRDVFIFNLSVKGTIEDYIIDILDSKINMFEMVIGEIEPILGHISQDDDFEHIIMGLWLKSGSDKELGDGFEKLGNDLMTAKKEYLKTKTLDEEIFGEDYEA